MATIFDLTENTAPDGTDRLYITDGTNDEGVQIANLLKGSGAEVPAAKITGTVSHEKGGLEADVSAYDGLIRISGGSTSNLKSNFAASAAPAVTDDSASGYVVGSRWIDTTNDKEYVCVDNTATAAVWTETTGGGGGGGGAIWMTSFGFSVNGKYYDNSLDVGYIASANLRKYSQLDTTSGDGESSIMQCAIPSSATSINSVILYLSANSTTAPTIDIYCAMRGEGETYNQGTFSNLTGQTSWYTQASANLLEYVDISAQFSSAAGGDQIAIGVKRTGGSDQCYVIGCLLQYS